jgi:hypothetical protein
MKRERLDDFLPDRIALAPIRSIGSTRQASARLVLLRFQMGRRRRRFHLPSACRRKRKQLGVTLMMAETKSISNSRLVMLGSKRTWCCCWSAVGRVAPPPAHHHPINSSQMGGAGGPIPRSQGQRHALLPPPLRLTIRRRPDSPTAPASSTPTPWPPIGGGARSVYPTGGGTRSFFFFFMVRLLFGSWAVRP